jgi:predicted metal-dependent peptidase
MAEFTVEQRVARARMSLMNHDTWMLYSGLLVVGKLSVEELPPPHTASTNGRDVKLDPRFVKYLTDSELRFLILHENEHKALRQISTYKFLSKQNFQLANIAMDFVVNIRLLDADAGEGYIKMIAGGCYNVKYRGWSSKQVFDDLMQNPPPPGSGKGQGKGGGTPGAGEPVDSLDEHDFDGAEEMTEEEKTALDDEIDTAVRQGGLLAGVGKGGKKNLLEDVLDSQIRWQEILAEFIKSTTKGRDTSSWAKINRRWISSGMYLPSAVSETVGGLLLAGDASGSTWSGDQLAGFLGEAKAIINDVVPEFVDFIWWDTRVEKGWHFEPEDYDTMIEEIKNIVGGGGTTPSCITDWIVEEKKKYVAAIVLSDGQVGSDWGDWSKCGENGGELPVLWCLNTKGITAPVGSTVYIESCERGY